LGLRDVDSGRAVTKAQFRAALLTIRPTNRRLLTIEAHAANPDGLTAAQLARLTRGPDATYDPAVFDVVQIAMPLAKALDLPRGDAWWVGAAFRGERVPPYGHLRLTLWPRLAAALAVVEKWSSAWERGRSRPPLPPEVDETLDDPGRIINRLARDRQSDFRKRMLDIWEARCAITGCEEVVALEAAHIDRYADTRRHSINSGLLLRADLHRLFDSGLLRLRPSREGIRVEVHPNVTTRIYRSLHGRVVGKGSAIDRDALDRHARMAARRAGW